MNSPQLATGLSFPGYSFAANEPPAAVTGTVVKEVVLPANSALNTGTLTTRTDDDTGVATLTTSHTIVTGKVDVYWAAGCRFGMDATKDVNAITIDGGAGDNLPTESTAVTLFQQTSFEINFDGDNALFVAVIYRNPSDTGAKASADFQDTGDATIEQIDLVHETANGGITKLVNVWNIANGDANVFTGNRITKVMCSHDSEYAGTIYVLIGQ